MPGSFRTLPTALTGGLIRNRPSRLIRIKPLDSLLHLLLPFGLLLRLVSHVIG